MTRTARVAEFIPDLSNAFVFGRVWFRSFGGDIGSLSSLWERSVVFLVEIFDVGMSTMRRYMGHAFTAAVGQPGSLDSGRAEVSRKKLIPRELK